MLKVSYNMVTYNRLELVKEHCEALANQVGLNKSFELEVIICADHCEDGTNEWLEKNAYKDRGLDIKPLFLDGERRGDSAARNECIKNSTHDIIMIADDDRIPDKYYVGRMAGIVRPGIIAVGNQDNWKSYPPSEQKIREPDWREFVTGSVGAHKRDLYSVEGFDENLGTRWGFGDIDMGFRLYILGCKSKLIKKAVGTHKNEDYSINPKPKEDKLRELEETREYLQGKYGLRWPPYDTLGRYNRYPNKLDLISLNKKYNFLTRTD